MGGGREQWGAGSGKVSASRSEAGRSRLLRPRSFFCKNLTDWGGGAAPQKFFELGDGPRSCVHTPFPEVGRQTVRGFRDTASHPGVQKRPVLREVWGS